MEKHERNVQKYNSSQKGKFYSNNKGPKNKEPSQGKKQGYSSYQEAEAFVNPYNFVPLLEHCDRGGCDKEEPDKHTGYLECELSLLTPLIIPNTSSEHALDSGEYKSYEFFSYENLSGIQADSQRKPPKQPVIPASAIRGPVRSVYEAAFNCCLSSVSLRRPLGRRSNQPKHPGLLVKKNDKWFLTPCKRAMLNVQSRDRKGSFDEVKHGKCVEWEEYKSWKEGEKIWITLSDEPYKQIMDTKVVQNYLLDKKLNNGVNLHNGMILGWLHKGEPFSRKHHESVFYKEADSSNDNKSCKEIPVKDSVIEQLRSVIKQYQDKEKDCYKEYCIDKINGPIPVYYWKNPDSTNETLYLSPSCIGKEQFTTTIEDLLKANGEYQPCTEASNMCSGCKVFGMVGSENNGKTEASGSKVRFTDASLSEESAQAKIVYKTGFLPEMGEPRPGAVEFYTFPPYGPNQSAKDYGWDNTQGYWTYDYLVRKDNKNRSREPINGKNLKIRGRKFYWHSGQESLLSDNTKMNPKMSQIVRSLQPKREDGTPCKFTFRVYFEQLSKQELSRLCWALDFGNPSCAHKIGHAKPLGYGSVNIKIKEIKFRTIDQTTGRWEVSSKDMNSEEVRERINSEENIAIKTVSLMANWEKKPDKVNYPIAEKKGGTKNNDKASHQWFAFNRSFDKETSSMNPAFHKILPKPEEELKQGGVLKKIIKY